METIYIKKPVKFDAKMVDKLYNNCQRLYNKGGVSAVIEYATKENEHFSKKQFEKFTFLYCEHCNTDTPYIFTAKEQRFCAICGQNTKDY